MKSSRSNLLVLFRNEAKNEQALKQELECLHEILHRALSPEQFCLANELVNRNHITSRKSKMLEESRRLQLRCFRFFINKN